LTVSAHFGHFFPDETQATTRPVTSVRMAIRRSSNPLKPILKPIGSEEPKKVATAKKKKSAETSNRMKPETTKTTLMTPL